MINTWSGSLVIQRGLGADSFRQRVCRANTVPDGRTRHIHEYSEYPFRHPAEDYPAKVAATIGIANEEGKLRARVKRIDENQASSPGRDAPREFQSDVSP